MAVWYICKIVTQGGKPVGVAGMERMKLRAGVMWGEETLEQKYLQ